MVAILGNNKKSQKIWFTVQLGSRVHAQSTVSGGMLKPGFLSKKLAGFKVIPVDL